MHSGGGAGAAKPESQVLGSKEEKSPDTQGSLVTNGFICLHQDSPPRNPPPPTATPQALDWMALQGCVTEDLPPSSQGMFGVGEGRKGDGIPWKQSL